MAWYDGTESFTEEKLFASYPNKICRGLFLSADGKRLAIVNDFEEGTPFYKAADPKREELSEKTVFYHVFKGEDAPKAKSATEEFIKTADLKNSDSVLLLRKDPDRLFSYGNGHICLSLLEKTVLLCGDDPSPDNMFILPLMLYFHRCPVCGKRTLSERGMFDICVECGWEDEGIDGEDEEPGFAPNGDYTIKEYRKKYLKLKAKDPLYSWWGDCLKREKENKEKR